MVQGYFRPALLGAILLCLGGAVRLRAQYAPPPDAYTIHYTVSLIMPNQRVSIYRDGDRVVSEEFTPRSGPMPHPTHTRSYLNLLTHRQWTQDLQDPSVPCGVSTLGGAAGDWSGNPFEWLSSFFGVDLSRLHSVGMGSMAGRKAEIFDIPGPGKLKTRIWVDRQYGLLLKMQGSGKNGRPQIILEVQAFTVGKPPAQVFEMPANCGGNSSSAGSFQLSFGPGRRGHEFHAIPIGLPRGTHFHGKWKDGTPLRLHPQEEVAFLFLDNISNLESFTCQDHLHRFCRLRELVRGIPTKTGLEGLAVNPRRDINYRYILRVFPHAYQVQAFPRRQGLGGWLLEGDEYTTNYYFNPHGPASPRDRRLGNFTIWGGSFARP